MVDLKCHEIDWSVEHENLGWPYCPSFPAAILFAVLFFLITVTHVVQAFAFRKKFCWVIVICGVWETAGFSIRVASTRNLFQLGFFIPQQLLIVLAPLFLNAFIYMVLGRMIYLLVPERKCFGISARKLSRMFVILDIVAFLVQASSSSLMSADDPKVVRIGINIYMGGIGLQELFILIFTALAIRFQRKMNDIEAVQPVSLRWRPLLYTLYAGLGLITLRIIYRMIEYSTGIRSPLATSEAAFYVLDAVPMFIAMGLLSIYHPGRVLIGPDSEFPKKEKKKKNGKKSKKGEKGNQGDENDSSDELNLEAHGIHRGTSRAGRQSRSREGGVLNQADGVTPHPHRGSDHVPLQHWSNPPIDSRPTAAPERSQPPYPL